MNNFRVDRITLPPLYPTERHLPEFWEQIGRTIATFGFLEEVLGRAIFALTATRSYNPEEIESAYKDWLPKLEHALSDTLWNLAEVFERSAKDNPELKNNSVSETAKAIKNATRIRNALCHGSWRTPDNSGKSKLLFIDKQGRHFQELIDLEYLRQVQLTTVNLACDVIDTVTQSGWQFPGGGGPGQPINV